MKRGRRLRAVHARVVESFWRPATAVDASGDRRRQHMQICQHRRHSGPVAGGCHGVGRRCV